ncbi:SAM-dependent chlorinase/fluorinase [Candidatus Bathyarchaeota archaeon]|nr:SAM-dependent chlorinase/fluorinase [Candidatus Bathyarchaeota archaeon]
MKIAIRGEAELLKLSSTYSEVPVGAPLTIVGSHGYLEFSVNQGSAKKLYKAKFGDPIRIQSQSHG